MKDTIKDVPHKEDLLKAIDGMQNGDPMKDYLDRDQEEDIIFFIGNLLSSVVVA